MSVTDYLAQTREGLREYTSRSVREALTSGAQVALLGGVGLLAGVITVAHALSGEPNKWVLGAGAVVTTGLGSVALIKGLDAQADIDHARYLNGAEFRNRTTTRLLDAGLAHITTPQYLVSTLERTHLERSWSLPPVYPTPLIEQGGAPMEQRVPGVDVVEELGRSPRSAIIVGQPGAGKGRLTKHALRALKRHHPDVTVWVLDPKQDPSERHQWESADRVSTVQLSPFPTPDEVEAFKREAEAFIEGFKGVEGAKLLVLDEAMAVKEVTGRWFSTLMAGFNALCSTGRSRRHWGWVISQSPNASDLGLSGGARNVYTRVLLVHRDDLGLLANGSTFYTGRPTEQDLGSPSGRAYYLSTRDHWGPLPTLD